MGRREGSRRHVAAAMLSLAVIAASAASAVSAGLAAASPGSGGKAAAGEAAITGVSVVAASAGAAGGGGGAGVAASAGIDRFDLLRLAQAVSPKREGETNVWEYELVISEQEHRLAGGTLYKVWAFGGQIPGPTLIAREGDRVRIKLINETSNPHTLHSHGLFVPVRMDGVPHGLDGGDGGHAHHSMGGAEEMPPWTMPVQPGESYTYDYIARPAGTHFYHCHVNTNEHLDRGMSGALIVLPRVPEPAVDRDIVLILDEWDTRYAREGQPGHPREAGGYDVFTLNGKSFPETDAIELALGQVLRLRLINAGSQSHSMHLHGHTFLVSHKDGRPLPEPLEMDTVAIAPGERLDLLMLGDNPGVWCFHCHTASHVTNSGRYPGGMLMHIQVGPAAFPSEGDGPVGSGLERVLEIWKTHRAAQGKASRS